METLTRGMTRGQFFLRTNSSRTAPPFAAICLVSVSTTQEATVRFRSIVFRGLLIGANRITAKRVTRNRSANHFPIQGTFSFVLANGKQLQFGNQIWTLRPVQHAQCSFYQHVHTDCAFDIQCT